MSKGIRWLSNINLVLALGLAVFFFVVGPTAFLANMLPSVIIEYLDEMPSMLSANMGQGEEMVSFLSSWITFYWAWWVSWSPFVGVFVAKISRGRTIRQYILGVLLIPSAIIVCAFTILGGTTIWLQRRDGGIAPDGTIDSMPPAEDVFFTVLDHLPGAQIMAPLVLVMLVVFFITTADSASIVNSQLTQRGNPNPKPGVTIGRRPQCPARPAEPYYRDGSAFRGHHCAHVYRADSKVAARPRSNPYLLRGSGHL